MTEPRRIFVAGPAPLAYVLNMSRTTFRRLLRMVLILSLPAAQAQPGYLEGLQLKSQGKPNIILIVAESLGHGDLGCYGQTQARTPSIDRLANEGVRFTHYYTGSPSPAASRISILTGSDARALARLKARGDSVPDRHHSLAGLLEAAGYVTGAIGTWGIAGEGVLWPPNQLGFHEWFGYLNPPGSPKAAELWRNNRRFALPADPAGKPSQDPADLLLRATLNFIRVNKHRPFFLYLAPPSRHPSQPGDAASDPDSRRAAAPAQAVADLDDTVGRILQALQETALDQETFVFFTSDTGPRVWKEGSATAPQGIKRPFKGGMGELHEGGIRVPMLVRAPGRAPAGSVNEVVWAAWDLLPTLAGLARAEVEIHPEQISVVPAIHGHLQTNLHSHLYWELPGTPTQQAVRMDNWKAIRPGPGLPLLLYDLRADAGEATNVAGDHPEVLPKLLPLFSGRPGADSPTAAGPAPNRPAVPRNTSSP